MSDPFSLRHRYDSDPGYYPDPEQYLEDELDRLISRDYERDLNRLLDEELEAEHHRPSHCLYDDEYFYDYDDRYDYELDDLLEGPYEFELPLRLQTKILRRRPKRDRWEHRDFRKPTSWKNWRNTRYRRIQAAQRRFPLTHL